MGIGYLGFYINLRDLYSLLLYLNKISVIMIKINSRQMFLSDKIFNGGAMNLLNGKEVSKKIKNDLKQDVESLKEKGVTPGLAVVIVGDNPASESYVSSKQRACEALGIFSKKYALDASETEENLLTLIEALNTDPDIHGILVQLPLPKHMDEIKVIQAINPKKDVDGFHPVSAGKLLIGQKGFKPCTPFGIIKLLDYYNIDVEGMHAVVMGRSNIVGKPIAMMLLERNATVTICHSKTENVDEILKQADLLVVAIGRPFYISSDVVKKGAIVVDVGINRVQDGLVGDVDFKSVKNKAKYITPVPGGVGPMTIAMLMANTVQAAKEQNLDA